MEREDGGTPSAAGERRYKGVRRRKWGRWVSEIRLPNSRDRIWLGSYDSPERAARAFDTAAVCLRGRRARLNFPDAPPPHPPRSLTHQQIQEAAARHAANDTSAAPPPQPPAAVSAADDEAEAQVSPSPSSPSEVALDDWSFMDPKKEEGTGEFLAIPMDDFIYEIFPPVPAPSESTPEADLAEDHGGVDFDLNSFLWSF